MAEYETAPWGIHADLTAGTVRDGYGGVDKLVNNEPIGGSNYNDATG